MNSLCVQLKKKSFSHAHFTSLAPPTWVDLFMIDNTAHINSSLFLPEVIQWPRWGEYWRCVSVCDAVNPSTESEQENQLSVKWPNLCWDAEFLNSSSRNSIRVLTRAMFHFSSSVFVLSVLFRMSGAASGPEFMHLLQQVAVFPMYRSAPARENSSSSSTRVTASPERQQSLSTVRTRHVPLLLCSHFSLNLFSEWSGLTQCWIVCERV